MNSLSEVLGNFFNKPELSVGNTFLISQNKGKINVEVPENLQECLKKDYNQILIKDNINSCFIAQYSNGNLVSKYEFFQYDKIEAFKEKVFYGEKKEEEKLINFVSNQRSRILTLEIDPKNSVCLKEGPLKLELDKELSKILKCELPQVDDDETSHFILKNNKKGFYVDVTPISHWEEDTLKSSILIDYCHLDQMFIFNIFDSNSILLSSFGMKVHKVENFENTLLFYSYTSKEILKINLIPNLLIEKIRLEA